jgi:pimeloyl-ACP methyl ester carboxylesterase
MTSPELSFKNANSLDLAVWHWPPLNTQTSTATLLFVHATGFHSRLWDEVVSEFPSYDRFAFDSRSHGRSVKLPPPSDWVKTGTDVALLGTELGIEGAIGIGHSMGGHNLCVAASIAPQLFSALILVDPIIFKPERYRKPDSPPVDYSELPTARRRNHFQSPEEMYERFKGRGPFNRWQPEVLKDYCEWGLLPVDGGKEMQLACAPLYESSIYANGNSYQANIYGLLDKIDKPVLVIRIGKESADDSIMNFDESSTNPKLASCFANGTDMHVPNYTHFFPMEEPKMLAQIIEKFIKETVKS